MKVKELIESSVNLSEDSCLFFPQSHYSVKKAAGFLGIGTDNVIVVKVDDG